MNKKLLYIKILKPIFNFSECKYKRVKVAGKSSYEWEKVVIKYSKLKH